MLPRIKPEEGKGPLRLPLALLPALRVRQWVKNGLVFLPFLFSVNQVWTPDNLAAVPQTLLHLAGVFLGFCALSSAVYLLNDLADLEAERAVRSCWTSHCPPPASWACGP